MVAAPAPVEGCGAVGRDDSGKFLSGAATRMLTGHHGLAQASGDFGRISYERHTNSERGAGSDEYREEFPATLPTALPHATAASIAGTGDDFRRQSALGRTPLRCWSHVAPAMGT